MSSKDGEVKPTETEEVTKLNEVSNKLDMLIGAIGNLVTVLKPKPKKTALDYDGGEDGVLVVPSPPKRKYVKNKKEVVVAPTKTRRTPIFTGNKFSEMSEFDQCKEDTKIDKKLNKGKTARKKRGRGEIRNSNVEVECKKCGKVSTQNSNYIVLSDFVCDNCIRS